MAPPAAPPRQALDDAPQQSTLSSPLLSKFSSTSSTYASLGLDMSARFFATQVHALAPTPATTLTLARLHAHSNPEEALHLLTTPPASQTDASARLLAAQSLFMLGHYDACLTLLGDNDAADMPSSALSELSLRPPTPAQSASLCVLRARVHEQQDNAARAVLCFKRALRADLFCVDAFVGIVYAQLIALDEARAFIFDVTQPFVRDDCCDQSSGDEADAADWLARYYRAAADRSYPLPTSQPCAIATLDVQHVLARRAFAVLNFSQCVSILRSQLDLHPKLPDNVMQIYLAALVELDEHHELFVTAHTLVKNDPKSAVAWLAVAYYYFAVNKLDVARRFLRKATALDARLAPAWVALGHAFAAHDESDQAVAAYRTVTRLFPGAQLPSLFIGIEYARQSSLSHAALLFQTAMGACQSDPAPRHELGVVAYRMGDMPRAAAYFKEALALWETSDGSGRQQSLPVSGRRAEAVEATLLNLGHCYRRLAQFARAKRCYERALALRPRSASTCTALGMTLHAMGQLPEAVAMYHRALRDNAADAMCNQLVERALNDMFSEPGTSDERSGVFTIEVDSTLADAM